MDLWPVSGLLFVNVSPHVANQIHVNPAISMQRPALLPRWFNPICGGPSLFDMREHEWKRWRGVFSKASNPEHTLSLVPSMVDETLVYCDNLKDMAEKGEIFKLDLLTLRFTIDVIGKTILFADASPTDMSRYRPTITGTQPLAPNSATTPSQTVCYPKSVGTKPMLRTTHSSILISSEKWSTGGTVAK